MVTTRAIQGAVTAETIEYVYVVDDGDRAEVVLLGDTRDLLLVEVRAHERDVAVHELRDGRLGGRAQERVNRADAPEAVLVVDDVDVFDRLGRHGALNRPQRLGGRERLGNRDEIERHAAAGGVLVVLPQLGDVLRVVLVELLHHRRLLLHRQMVDDVGDDVGGHLLDDVLEPRLSHAVDDRDARVVPERAQDLRRGHRIERLEHADAVREIEVVEQFREVHGLDGFQEDPETGGIEPFVLKDLGQTLLFVPVHQRMISRPENRCQSTPVR
jgi:hypothetical protein